MFFEFEFIPNNEENKETVNRVDNADEKLRKLSSDDDDDDDDNNKRKHKINNNRDIYDMDIQSEELETDYGYHANILDPITTDTSNFNTKSKTFGLPSRLPNQEYVKLMTQLNTKQHDYIMNFTSYIKREEQFFHFIRGGSGTGKSHLIKAIYQTHLRYFNPNENNTRIYAVIGALTGKAAFNIKGDTITRLFHLPTRGGQMVPLASNAVKKANDEFRQLKLIILDEISMIGCKNFAKIDQRMRQIMGKNVEFGGVSITVVGDFNQLPPIQESMVYANGSLDTYSRLVPNVLWNKFRMFELTQIMRQSPGEVLFAEALNKLGDDGIYGLKSDQVKLLDSRIVQEKDIDPRCVVLYWEKKKVAEYNRKKLSAKDGDLVENFALNTAEGNGKDKSGAKKMAKKCEKIDDLDQTSGLPCCLLLKIDCKYMLTNNENVQDGLVNGASGVLKAIIIHLLQQSVKMKLLET